MKSRIHLIIPSIGLGLLASCYPLPDEPTPEKTATQAQQTITSEEQQKIQEQRDRMREEAERSQREAQQTTERRDISPPPPPEPTRTSEYPFARPVPGKAGFVFSPYNNKVIDVREIPSGTLVTDPTFPEADKKFFRVP